MSESGRPYLPRSAAGPYNPWLIAMVVSIATFMEVLDSTIANVSLRHIAGSLGASQAEGTWILTSYLVANAIVLPISGWLSNVVGRKRFYMSCVALFTIASFLCSTATSMGFMVAMRVLQGLGGGGLAPVEQSIFADTFPEEMRAKAFAVYGLTILVAPALGPILGGWLTDNFTWHWVFLINIPIGILSLTLTYLFVYEPAILHEDRKRLLSSGGFRVDYLGFGLVAIGFGCLQILLDRFQQDDGFSSGFILILAVIAGLSLALLAIWEWQHPHPAVDLKLLRARSFAVSNLLMFLLGFLLMSTSQLLPQLAQSLLSYDATTAGLTLGFSGMVTILMMPLAGFLASGVVRPQILLFVAFSVTGLALIHDSQLPLGVDFWTLSMARTYQVIALPFMFIPISTVSYIGLPPGKNNESSAILNMTRNLGSSIGVAVASIWFEYRTQFHHARLAEHVTSAANLGGRTLAQVAQTVQTQAQMMSYLDIFYAMGVLTLLVCPAVFLLRSPPKRTQGKGAMAHGH